MDNLKGTDHSSLEQALQADIKALQAEGGAMDVAGLERRGFEAVRAQMDAAARLVKAEECKFEANSQFSAKEWLASLVGYMAAIWFIQRGDPACPAIVASESDTEALSAVPALLGSGTPGAPELPVPKDVEAQVEALRVTLHLNLAAAALRLHEYLIARTACEYVLMLQGAAASSKARYRLAKAMEGQGFLADAIGVLERLIELEPGNEEARKLLQALREREPMARADDAPSSAAPSVAPTAPSTQYDQMGAADWAKMSKEEQWKAILTINQSLDAEMGESPPYDEKALEAALGPIR